MPATDYFTQIHTQVWALLEASAAFTGLVRPGDRRKLNKPTAPKSALQFADTPDVTIDLDGSDETVYTGDEHFGEVFGEDPTHDSWLESSTYRLRITIVMDDDQVSPANKVAAELKKALRDGGPALGLAFVARWGPLTRRDLVTDSGTDARGRRRRVMVILLPVVAEVQGNAEL